MSKAPIFHLYIMRTLCLFIFASLVALLASPASAQLVIYKGTLKQTGTGEGVSVKLTSKFYLIVDSANGHVAEIQYVIINNSKMYATGTETNGHILQISAPKGKTIQAISQPPNDCDISQGNTNDLVFVQGADSQLTVNTGTTITFPKTLSGGDTEADTSQGSPIVITSSLVVSFDSAETLLSNGNPDTLDAALARISSLLESQGYVKQAGLSKKSIRSLISPLDLKL